MEEFKQNVDIVLARLEELNYSIGSMKNIRKFYEALGDYLGQKGSAYTPAVGEAFLESARFAHRTELLLEKSAVSKLNDIYETGFVDGTHISVLFLSRSITLTSLFERITAEFLECVSDEYSNTQMENISRRCKRFFRFTLMLGRSGAQEITYDDILSFHLSLGHMKGISRTVEESSVIGILSYMAKKGMCRCGLPLYLKALETGKAGIYSLISRTAALSRVHDGFMPGMCRKGFERIIEAHKAAGYSDEYIPALCRGSDMVYLFLDFNGLRFDYDIIKEWLSASDVQEAYGHDTLNCARRLSFLLDRYGQNGEIDLSAICQKGMTGPDKLPAWCSGPLIAFADERRREKLDETTVKNYVYSCIRFCRYLVDNGLSGFWDVTGGVLAAFNLYDSHGSSEGKNSCNHRIRKFLKYLYREGLTSNPQLYAALGTSWAVDEKAVVVLNDEEIGQIDEYIKNARSSLELRNSAMLLLGTEIGMRGGDIVCLTLEDIDWKKQTIRFMQDKTDVETELHMPCAVGNAIYRYLKNGRPRNLTSGHLFVHMKPPYCSLTRSACYAALRAALPGRDVKGSGFHVARKTFATCKLMDGVAPEMISIVLGQSGKKAVTPYLSLDSERMRMCPVSLVDLGIAREEGDAV